MSCSTRLLVLLLIGLCPLPLGHAAPQAKPYPIDLDTITNVMAGDYIVVGKQADSNLTYSGRLTFSSHAKTLNFARTVHGRTVRGAATFATVTGDRIPVMRMRFAQDGRLYEGTYQWSTDYDNYMRFTGYVYRTNGKTKTVGMEMLFPLAPTRRD